MDSQAPIECQIGTSGAVTVVHPLQNIMLLSTLHVAALSTLHVVATNMESAPSVTQQLLALLHMNSCKKTACCLSARLGRFMDLQQVAVAGSVDLNAYTCRL